MNNEITYYDGRFVNRPYDIFRDGGIVLVLKKQNTSSVLLGLRLKVHRLASARSRSGSDSPQDCHSIPSRRFATPMGRHRLESISNFAFNQKSISNFEFRIHFTLRSALCALHSSLYFHSAFCVLHSELYVSFRISNS